MAGNLLLLNFGTYAETNRFKALAIERKFLSSDLMDAEPLGELLRPGSVRTVRRGGSVTYSFYGLSAKVWGSKLADGTLFRDAFKKWMEKVVSAGVHCVYLTGHHWDDHTRHRYMILSWGEDTDHFHARIDTDKKNLEFGVSARRVSIDIEDAFRACRLVLGFGCNVATGINSGKYQGFFGGSAIVLGWERSVAIPRAGQESVNGRFFEYLDGFVQKQANVPDEDRLEWFYQNHPMELVRAWGEATRNWLQQRARARDRLGDFYKFKLDKRSGNIEPVKA